MGLLSWWRKERPAASSDGATAAPPAAKSAGAETQGMNGAEEVVRRPSEVTVFEFGSAAASGDRVTLAGYCPVSEELEPCRWEILPAAGSDAPQFRVVF
ncbi:allyl alcohol dehydrogenase-like protein [Wolffia australiana]